MPFSLAGDLMSDKLSSSPFDQLFRVISRLHFGRTMVMVISVIADSVPRSFSSAFE